MSGIELVAVSLFALICAIGWIVAAHAITRLGKAEDCICLLRSRVQLQEQHLTWYEQQLNQLRQALLAKMSKVEVE